MKKPLNEVYEPGDDILVFQNQYGYTSVSQGVVHHITPTGRINVRLLVNGLPNAGQSYSFMPHGTEVGAGWRAHFILPPDEAIQREKDSRAERIRREGQKQLSAIIAGMSGQRFNSVNYEWWENEAAKLLQAAKQYYDGPQE